MSGGALTFQKLHASYVRLLSLESHHVDMSKKPSAQDLTQWVAVGSATLHRREITSLRAAEIAAEVERLNDGVSARAHISQSLFDDPFQFLRVLESLSETKHE